MIIKSKEENDEFKNIIKSKKFNVKVDYDTSKVSKPEKIIYKYNENIMKKFIELSKEYGFINIGFTKVSPDVILNNTKLEYDNAIILVHEIPDRLMETEPGDLAKLYSDNFYEELANKTYALSDFLRKNNVDTETIHPEYDEFINFSKIAAKANLGGIGGSGLLIRPELGPKVKFSVILTSMDLPNKEVKEDYSWIKEYCKRCNKCAKACEYNALTEDTFNRKKCKGCNEGCTYCINACPFYKKGYDNIKRKFIKYNEKMEKKLKKQNK
ncbi:hypothetical protein BGI41_06850 [Methanobrevibacter sp. 87.7]|uniref:4Fe-4S binding protein n=1 Tax=Methanobrevibacter sp. 87.7 TaxID=387957 RepID=UPI000B514601|nr:4Fe-4S binding protein [Methanobrevibacter sp. 87.7]OWT32597.1 hypothetical protein BGI41_06850 [Methanobrevibacter sp. 87.7]